MHDYGIPNNINYMSKLEISVKDFRAIADAAIELNGITVISGINSAGKSTLSKLLYYAVKLTLELEEITTKNLIHELRFLLSSLSRFLNEQQTELREFRPDDRNRADLLWQKKAESLDIDALPGLFSSLLGEIEQSFIRRDEQKPFSQQELTRIGNAMEMRAFRKAQPSASPKNVFELFDNIRVKSNELFDKAFSNIKLRPISEIKSRLNIYLKSYDIPLSLFEDEIQILDFTKNRVNNIFSVQQVFYSDTPMVISDYIKDGRLSVGTDTPHWDFLKRTILETPTVILDDEQKQVAEDIAEIINGNISLEVSEFERGFSYKRASDGLSIELSESATGIKSFAILQLLLSEGLLNEKTLFILDEPEAHLHPQWIVEYARILVLLNKKLGVKFMIASHNPDMVSALRYISEKEEILDNVNFYLAEKVKGREQFNYRNLNNDIEPIFKSFNIALDRINQYGI